MVKMLRPSLRVIDFAGDLRLVEEDGARGRLFASMVRIMELLAQIGVRFHTRGGKRWWLTQSIPWLGFVVNAERGVVGIDAGKRQKGVALCDAVVSLPPCLTISARTVLSTRAFLDFPL